MYAETLSMWLRINNVPEGEKTFISENLCSYSYSESICMQVRQRSVEQNREFAELRTPLRNCSFSNSTNWHYNDLVIQCTIRVQLYEYVWYISS